MWFWQYWSLDKIKKEEAQQPVALLLLFHVCTGSRNGISTSRRWVHQIGGWRRSFMLIKSKVNITRLIDSTARSYELIGMCLSLYMIFCNFLSNIIIKLFNKKVIIFYDNFIKDMRNQNILNQSQLFWLC
jgi:hypothetical protein